MPLSGMLAKTRVAAKARLFAFFTSYQIWPPELEADHERYYAERQKPTADRPQGAWPTMNIGAKT